MTINVNGCPNACARTQIADIGLKGMIVTTRASRSEGFQVHLGGGLGLEADFGRKGPRPQGDQRGARPTTSSGVVSRPSTTSVSRGVVRPVGGPRRRGAALLMSLENRA